MAYKKYTKKDFLEFASGFDYFKKDEKKFKKIIPKKNRISIMEKITNNGKILITDRNGILLTPDRKHLTKYGAKVIGKKVFKDSNLSNLLEK